MSEHVHKWEPKPEAGHALYRCACGQWGKRRWSGPNKGKLLPISAPREEPHVVQSEVEKNTRTAAFIFVRTYDNQAADDE